jgi:hypothetical protein
VRARIAAQGVKIQLPRGGQFSRAVDTGIPLLGSALDLRRDLLATFEQAHHRYGDVIASPRVHPGCGS